MAQKIRRSIDVEDLYCLNLVSDCQISPDGQHIIFCHQRIEKSTEKKFTNLWLVGACGGEARQLTVGEQSDSQPRWSPDGRFIAFLSDRGGQEQKQIYQLPFQGGEARPITRLVGEFASFCWSPDGRQIAIQFRQKDREALEREATEEKRELGIVVRHIKRLHYKEDGSGYLPEERWHIWIVDVESGQASKLTLGNYDEVGPVWSPNGWQIAFLSNRQPDPDLDPDAIDVYLAAVSNLGADQPILEKIPSPLGHKSMLSFSLDGKWLAYVGREGRGDWWKNDSLWVVPTDGSATPRDLTGEYDLNVGNGTVGDFADRPTVAPVWTADAQALLFQHTCHGSTTLKKVALDGSPPGAVIAEPGVVGTFTCDRMGRQVACCWGDFLEPGDIWLRDLEKGEFKRLTHMNEMTLKDIELGQAEIVWIDGLEGNKLQGWILKPADFDPDRRYPSILEIHGGPWLQYGHTFMHEFQYLAAQGYVIYFCNPRGSQGYGQSFSRAIHNDWGTVDYADLMTWADYVAGLPYIDSERMGVMGGSYGGYMTAWIIGHTERFKAAVAQRVVSNLVSMWGSSDFNWEFQQEFGNQPPWQNLDNFWRQSPMATIGQTKTPTLIMHSENDQRCDLEQGLQLYVALKYLGVDSELILFPGESHGLSRNGRTDRRVARLQHILRWFDLYLK